MLDEDEMVLASVRDELSQIGSFYRQRGKLLQSDSTCELVIVVCNSIPFSEKYG